MDFRRLRKSWHVGEAPKAHDEIPDMLGIGIIEYRDEHGQLHIVIDTTERGVNRKVVLGKYRKPREDGKQFYLADWTRTSSWNPVTTYHEHLIMALAEVHLIAERCTSTDYSDPNHKDQDHGI